MNSVLDRYRSRANQAIGGELPAGSLTYSRDLSPGSVFHAMLDGELVKVIAEGNISGWSPSFRVVLGTGQTGWVPESALTVIDPIVLPIDPSSRGFTRSGESGPANRN